jgi:hypothetical protein
MAKRIEFQEAIDEKLLLKNRFHDLSFPQRVVLKIFYGCELSERKINDINGFSELDYWSIFHDFVERDELGYPLKVLEGAPVYKPQEYREGWFIFGRRGGKTDAIASTVVAYEAILGGHEDRLRPRQQGVCFQIAQDLRLARNSLHFIRAAIESSPLMEKEIVQVTADRIDFKNRFTIACVPATLKSVRGYASPISVMDEVGVWYQESESANPDYQIYDAVSPGQVQFPNRKIVGISTPWNKSGLLYKYHEAGTEGWKYKLQALREEYQGVCVLKGPTAVLGNKLVEREFLKKEKDRNPMAFEREMLAEFQDSISGFIPSILVNDAVDHGIYQRPYDPRYTYYAAMDPAFKRDAFGFAICHNQKGTIVVDAVQRMVPANGETLNPGAVLDVIIPLMRAYRCNLIYSDQYHLESLGQLTRERGFEIFPVKFTSKSKAELYGNLQQLFLQKRIRLVDDYELIRELKSLERTLTSGGAIQISAPPGQHDDMATVLVIAAAQAMWDFRENEKAEDKPDRELEYRKIIQEQIHRNWGMNDKRVDDDW